MWCSDTAASVSQPTGKLIVFINIWALPTLTSLNACSKEKCLLANSRFHISNITTPLDAFIYQTELNTNGRLIRAGSHKFNEAIKKIINLCKIQILTDIRTYVISITYYIVEFHWGWMSFSQWICACFSALLQVHAGKHSRPAWGQKEIRKRRKYVLVSLHKFHFFNFTKIFSFTILL